MVRNSHADSIIAEEERQAQSAAVDASDLREMISAGESAALRLGWLPSTPSSNTFSKRCLRLRSAFRPIFEGLDAAFLKSPASEDIRWLRDNGQLIYSELRSVTLELKPRKKLPHVRGRKGEIVPRVLALAQAFLDEVGNCFVESEFSAFCAGFQQKSVLELREINSLVPALKLILLERIAARGRNLGNSSTDNNVGLCVRSLRDVAQTPWREVLEPQIRFEHILREDPSGSYPLMDFESRNFYRRKLAQIAGGSDRTEMEVAEEALTLAREARARSYRDPRVEARESHIGYYLVAEGVSTLGQRVGFRPRFDQAVTALLKRHPDEFFLPGITLLSFAIITCILLLLSPPNRSPEMVLLSMLILLLPSSQAAVQVMNYLVTSILPAEILPKLDFSEGVPADCVTLVAIPTLLLNNKQVHTLVEDLEVRYLGNLDPNVHFALVSDLADSDQPATEDSPLVELCSNLIRRLNGRYSKQGAGTFFLFHRHRVYNPREKGWMGWERKRGKLLDLNKLLRGTYDSFPVKAGDLSILPNVRFVITLDSDTELPRGSAQRMIGTLVHPLNQAIIDPAKNIVVAGYGILQPRVGVSVQSTARSRLAAIYAGETGLDIYTRAISDVYQDLYGEGSFTGKGIYEVDTVQRVLDRRFPRNSLLSHDLIEGAYARAGLASDVEVIEDYPSHYSAYNRRKHRWLRGDWQTLEWLTSSVRDESLTRVENPISLVSKLKIFDNLRRSLVEPATFVLFLFGWLVAASHPDYWTLATICILFIPAWFELAFNLVRAIVKQKQEIAREAVSTFFTANFTGLLTLVFLAHQTLLSLDAVARALIRRMWTRERLLEWETAAEAELGKRRTPIDRYLDWMPFLAVAVGLLVWWQRPQALVAAVPILALWASSKLVALWLNESPMDQGREIPRKDADFLRNSALFTWRYFAEFSSEEHHWLVPDNVQQKPPRIAARVSPTNLGLLLNARQAAVEFGYLTVPEMAELTRKTLATVFHLPKHRGHLLNWYDTRTLEPLTPLFVSSVDSGNFLASLWTLQHGSIDLLQRPLLSPSLAEGVLDCLRVLHKGKAIPRRVWTRSESELEGEHWATALLNFPEAALESKNPSAKLETNDLAWFREQAKARLQNIREMVRAYMPWMLPEFAVLKKDLAIDNKEIDDVTLELLPDSISWLGNHLDELIRTAPGEDDSLYARLRAALAEAHSNALRLIEDLQTVSGQAAEMADAMDFAFLLDNRRKLMSVGFDVKLGELQAACYDLLATESRTAVFVAIAKDDVPQDCWFRLGRAHTLDHGRPVLLSWTGTMFEYLMPVIWMRSYANTLLDRATLAAVRSQEAYVANKGVPWGISESAFAKLDDSGNYQYQAFGLPQLALMRTDSKSLVISPYSTFLALHVDRAAALSNLRHMESLDWFGTYGFYEAADYMSVRSRFRGPQCEVLVCWMAHHQGMSLLSLANVLRDNVVQRWFHSDRRVQATELLLHEKPVSHVRRSEFPFKKSAA